MRDFKNIDRLFQENLKDLEAVAPNKSWSIIEKNLIPTRKRIIPNWVKISGVAAMLALIFTLSNIYFIPNDEIADNQLPISEDTEIINDKESIENKEIPPKEIIPKPKILTESSTTIVEEKPEELLKVESKEFLTDVIIDDNDIDMTVDNSSSKINLEKFQENKKIEEFEVKSDDKFTVATIFAPIYFNSIGDDSGLGSQFGSNSTSAEGVSYSYGVKFAYKLNRKFSIQSGVNYINLGQTTNDVYVNTSDIALLRFSDISGSPTSAKGGSSKESGSMANLNQVFGYVEIPVEIKYNITDGKFGINLVGGFSTLLLNKDELFVETNSFSQSLGNSNSLRPINFSGNLGLDIDYSIYKNIYLNVSPMFKIHTNTFSKNSGNIQTYYIGVYTGLNYKF